MAGCRAAFQVAERIAHPHAAGRGDEQRAAGAGMGRRHQAARSASQAPGLRAAPYAMLLLQ